MPINPGKKETQQEFIARCVAEEVRAGYPQDQAVAICYSKWKEHKKKPGKKDMSDEDVKEG